MTDSRKAVLRTVRLDDDVWAAVKAMNCSLNQYLRAALFGSPSIAATQGSVRQQVGVLPSAEMFDPVADNRPKDAFCKHCGSRFAGVRFATICPDCKSGGHTNQPNECPRCNEASAI